MPGRAVSGICEVKYRSTNESGLPEEAVDLRKQRQISRVAAWYLTEKGLDIYTPCRFDVVAIEEKRSGFTGMHFSTRVKRRNLGDRDTCKYGKTDRKSFKKDEIQKTNSQYQKLKQYSRRADYGHSLETGIYRRYGSQENVMV